MFGYIMVGVTDKARSRDFFDGLMAAMGHAKIFDKFHMVCWGEKFGKPWFGICTPENREPATLGNGSMVAFECESEADVDRFYQKALELGGTCAGKPGPRPAGYYCAYFRDPDGNKFNFHKLMTDS